MGEDYEEDIPVSTRQTNNTPSNTPDAYRNQQVMQRQQQQIPQQTQQQPQSKFGQHKLPTFDELMQQELKGKNNDDWNDDDD
jgi:hypothetical protein